MKFFILTIFAVTGVFSQNYCDTSLCQFYNGVGYETRPHIACPGNAVNECPTNAQAIPMDAANKGLVLKLHNQYRNALAGGQINGFAKAAALPEMTWDDELASIAAKNAMTCKYGHDKCHNTATFKYSGQNIAYAMNSAHTDQIFLEDRINAWWNEYKDCSQTVLDNYQNTAKVVGHFTAMSSDRSNKIGCAAVRYNTNYRYIVCNYGYTNMMGEPIYKKGDVKKCNSGASSAYPNLCSAKEAVKPMPYTSKRSFLAKY